MVVPLRLHVGDLEVALGGHDPVVPQGVLDADQRRIRIEHLGGHGVPQLMAAGSHLGLADILLHALLDTAHRQPPAAAGPFLNHKDEPHTGCADTG